MQKQEKKKEPPTKRRKASIKSNENINAIVAIGASAGGLEAVSALLANLPSDTGLSFFYVQHLSPSYPSELAMLLSKSTAMSVQDAKDGVKIARNCVYVCIPNKEMQVREGSIRLTTRPNNKLPYLPIDDFFLSLARNYGNKVVGIVLSGNATDGTKGLKAIRDAGGMTFAQDKTAKYDSMPKSAISAGAVNFIHSPKGIAMKLTLLAENGVQKSKTAPAGKLGKQPVIDSNLTVIFDILYKKTGVDFSHYKPTTIKRRLNYRLQQYGAQTVSRYVKVLLADDVEVNALYNDLLINITAFFRDESAFRYLKGKILPKLFKDRTPDEPLRIWVPGCSSGEEAYSIAMIFTEFQDNRAKKIPFKIFATDLSTVAVRDARIGVYSEREVGPVSGDRLKRFFELTGKSYRVRKELREKCVFAQHNVLRDPPFLRMDLVSCRNLLIYFDASVQKRTLTTLHFAMNDGGFLLLGKSESVGGSSRLFSSVSNKYRLFVKKKFSGTQKLLSILPAFPKKVFHGYTKSIERNKDTSIDSNGLDKMIDSVLLSNYMPACAIINKDMDILKFRGNTSLYLKHSSGNANLNILKMTSPEFSIELRSAILSAIETKQVARCSGVDVKIDSKLRTMSLEVWPLKIETGDPLLLIVFILDAKGTVQSNHSREAVSASKSVKQLTDKLNSTRNEMRALIVEHESAYSALQSANEEIVSSSEEFQTLNEELETSKEEIEAANEELLSTNQELLMRNDLLNESYKYSEAIIATIHEPMLVLDSTLHVKSANNSFYNKFLVNKDETVGSSVFELGNRQWNIPKLRKLLLEIITNDISFKNLEITHTFQGLGERIMQLNAHRIVQKTHKEQLLLLAIEDITDRSRRFLLERTNLKKEISDHATDKLKLEKAVKLRTKELEKKNQELIAANKELTSFTYISSHDLQEPLRKIKNFVSVLMEEERSRLSDEGKHYLERTYYTANRMQSLIGDLLTYSRAKNNDRRFEKILLNTIVDEARKDLEQLITDSQATIKVSNLCNVNVISFQFVQLFQNLISNSIKYARADLRPRIVIKSEIVKGNKTNIADLSHEIDYCHISVADNGIGFNPQYNERIFEVFQRLHSPDKYAGTGMGLAICKRVVENHNGIIKASGVEGKGATFDIYIPAKRSTVTETTKKSDTIK